MFLKATKKLLISVVSRTLVDEIAKSNKVSYSAIRKRVTRAKFSIRIKELRSYWSSFMARNRVLISEDV